METKVVSTRIPVDVASELDKMCDQLGISKSEYLANKVGVDKQKTVENYTRSNPDLVPQDVYKFLAGAGAATVGVGSYNFVYKIMSDAVDEHGKQRFTQSHAQLAGFMAAFSIGLISYGAFDSLMGDE